jgi:hypothetical protein
VNIPRTASKSTAAVRPSVGFQHVSITVTVDVEPLTIEEWVREINKDQSSSSEIRFYLACV